MNAIILCGGLSTRLGDITRSIPKVLLDIGNRTVLDWQIEKLKRLGIREVVLAAGHLSHVIERDIGESRLGIRLIYAIEKDRLGTGGAVKNALARVPDREAPTIVLNGDILTTVPLSHMATMLDPLSEGLILGSKVPNASSYGTLVYNDRRLLTEFREKEGIEKPGYINGGMYFFTPHASKYFPEESAFSIEYDVFPRMKKLYVYESNHPWIDIGVPERLAWARGHWEVFLE